MFTISYVPPYANGAIRTQTFESSELALSMINFYKSCGTKAWMN